MVNDLHAETSKKQISTIKVIYVSNIFLQNPQGYVIEQCLTQIGQLVILYAVIATCEGADASEKLQIGV